MARDASEPPPASPVQAPDSAPPALQTLDIIPESRSQLFTARSAKQLGLFFAGAGFFTLSTFITRRAVSRKLRAALPSFYQPSHRPPGAKAQNSDGSFIAFEALNLATVNVLSFALMAGGAAAWAFDISSVADLRRKARKSIGMAGKTDEEAEQEVEEWIAKVLSRKEKLQSKDKPEDQTKRQ